MDQFFTEDIMEILQKSKDGILDKESMTKISNAAWGFVETLPTEQVFNQDQIENLKNYHTIDDDKVDELKNVITAYLKSLDQDVNDVKMGAHIQASVIKVDVLDYSKEDSQIFHLYFDDNGCILKVNKVVELNEKVESLYDSLKDINFIDMDTALYGI